jgi:catechol 2,3-dioxygenase-like lactoylglutathione lyase family enzyme
MEADGIDHVNLCIPEGRVDEAVRFYGDVLGFEPEKLDLYREGERTSFAFRMGPTSLLHIRPVDDFEPPSSRNFDHCCIIVDRTVDELRKLCAEHDIAVEREGNPWGATGRAPAIYVTDPFGYSIELKQSKEV